MLALLLVVEGFREKWGESVERINAAPRPVRWSMYFALCWVILLFGAHGVEMEDKQFIYFQF
jgi:hypothetical protein